MIKVVVKGKYFISRLMQSIKNNTSILQLNEYDKNKLISLFDTLINVESITIKQKSVGGLGMTLKVVIRQKNGNIIKEDLTDESHW